ncbi:hypothetical protein L1049_008043 [Liquidambar formosana]|uniref:Uncharacterized protein n=1 Tax=Liquidambar formosana TaxID=63359 RepID=A0AAP0X564_LIQFO
MQLEREVRVVGQKFSELLGLLGEMLPYNNEMLLSMYEAKKTLTALGMEYEKIHECPKDCILYRKEYKDAISCLACGTSRWKVTKNVTEKTKGVPDKREYNGHLRYPVDSPA